MKYIGLFLVAFFFIGCGGTAKPEVISYPSWYLNPPQNTSSYLYGVGEGSSITLAKASALSSVSESLSLTVSSELKKSEQSIRDNGVESTYTSVATSLRAEAKEMEFSDYSIVQNQQIGTKIILVVKVSRQRLFTDQKAKLELYSSALKAQVKSISKNATFKQAYLYQERAVKQHKLKSLALLTQTINPSFEINPYILQSREVGNASQNALNKIRVIIKGSAEGMVYIDAVKEGLNKAGIETVTHNANAELYIKNSFQTDTLYGFKIAKATLTLSIKQNKKTISSNTIILSGKSQYSYEKAKSNSAQLLRNKIKQDSIFTILGVK